jgi:hypothetical protein
MVTFFLTRMFTRYLCIITRLTSVGFTYICHCFVTGLQVPHALFSVAFHLALQGSILFTDKQIQTCDDSACRELRSGSGIMSHNSSGEGSQHVTEKTELLVGQLSCRWASISTFAILMCEMIYIISFGRLFY